MSSEPLRLDPFGAFVCRAEGAAGAGPLAGWRLAVKDNIAVAQWPFTAGLPCFASRRANADAPVVAALRRAGAAVVGVTATDAGGFGVVAPGVTNPRDASLIAGGSSGGSAAAVAGGLADLALGTDTGGSVRIPAACCGVFGFKPSHGALPADGVWPLAPALETVGFLAADLRRIALAFGVASGASPPVAASTRTIRLGVDRADLARLDTVVAERFLDALRRLRRAGLLVREVDAPDPQALLGAHSALVLDAARERYASIDADRLDADLGGTAARALRVARTLDPSAVAAARGVAETLATRWRDAWSEVDCVVSPTLAVPVPSVGVRRIVLNGAGVPALHALTRQTVAANLAGWPAVAIPFDAGRSSLQVMARRGADAALLQMAAQIADSLTAEGDT